VLNYTKIATIIPNGMIYHLENGSFLKFEFWEKFSFFERVGGRRVDDPQAF
jgi:hypothetical protein